MGNLTRWWASLSFSDSGAILLVVLLILGAVLYRIDPRR